MRSTRGPFDVCIISQYWEPDINGDVTRLRRALSAFASLGKSVVLIAGAPHYPSGAVVQKELVSVEDSPGLRVVRLRMPSIPHSGLAARMIQYFWFCLGSIPLTVSYGRAPCVWAFSQRVFSTYTALVHRLFWGSRLTSDITDIWPEAMANTGHADPGSLFFGLARLFALFAYRTSDRVTVLTSGQRRVLSSSYGVPGAKTMAVPNVSNPLPSGPANYPYTVLYYGNVGKNYDFGPLVDAAKGLAGSGVRFMVKGDGESLKEVLEESRGVPNLEFVGRRMARSELEALIAGSGALVLPMAPERIPDVSFPIKFVECLWSGKPMVYVGGGYPAELIGKNSCGIAVRNGDVDGLVAAIRSLASDPQLSQRLAANALRLAEEQFSEESLKTSLSAAFN
ncbi:MAG: glycosyltransferase family 4 protein [Nitrososphaerota archaeon]|nr:glycosyltransferase family 4 protein [Nitrososphaerota archaeon]